LKIGYTNADYILAYLPAAKNVQTQLTEYEAQLIQKIQDKYQNLQKEVAYFEQHASTMIAQIRKPESSNLKFLGNSSRAMLDNSCSKNR